jgi:hypothetical protein
MSSSIVIPAIVANHYEKLRDTIREYKRAATRDEHANTITNCLRFILLDHPVGWDRHLQNLPMKLVDIVQNLRSELQYTVMFGASTMRQSVYKQMIWNTWIRDFPKSWKHYLNTAEAE